MVILNLLTHSVPPLSYHWPRFWLASWRQHFCGWRNHLSLGQVYSTHVVPLLYTISAWLALLPQDHQIITDIRINACVDLTFYTFPHLPATRTRSRSSPLTQKARYTAPLPMFTRYSDWKESMPIPRNGLYKGKREYMETMDGWRNGSTWRRWCLL